MTRSKWIGVGLLVVAVAGALLFGPRALSFRRERLEHLAAGSAAIAKSEELLHGEESVDEVHRVEFERAMADAQSHSELARDNADGENRALKFLAVSVLVSAAGAFLVFRRKEQVQPQR